MTGSLFSVLQQNSNKPINVNILREQREDNELTVVKKRKWQENGKTMTVQQLIRPFSNLFFKNYIKWVMFWLENSCETASKI